MADSRIELNMDLSVEELSGLFVSHGWQYGQTPIVTPDHIRQMINDNVRTVLKAPRGIFRDLGRFIVYRDHEFPDSCEILLRIGHATEYPIDLDTPKEGNK